jgi:predicted TIM-barrel fold metal-dependent hydrolase
MDQKGIAPLIIAIVVVVVVVIASVGVYVVVRGGGGGGENNPPSGTYSGGPILIQNDYQFTAANGVVSGSGTVSDPYIIENWVIDASGSNGIDIQNTTTYFIVRNCLIRNSPMSTHGGIRVNNAANGIVENNVCENFTDTGHMDMFDSHVHIMSTASASLAITEMDKAGVSMALLYPIDGCDDSDSIAAMSQYPDRFVAFVDTPDSPEPATWYTEGQAFTAFADAQMRTGKFRGIGETNLRYYSTGFAIPPPDIYVPPDDPLWLRLVDMAAQYHASISFHFIPDDVTANAALVRMMDHNAGATLIWCHMGFNNTPLSSTALGNYLLEHPNLYFDACPGSAGWEIIANQSDGRLSEEWRQFFERWNSRIMFGTDAGGGPNGLERWLNYADNVVEGAAPNAVGYWRYLISNMDESAAYNVMSGNSRNLFLGEQRPAYRYLVPSDGKCYPITVSSASSVSGLGFDKGTRTVSFTVADSTNTAGSATVSIPTALVRGNFTARIDGQSVQITEVSNSTYTTISLEYAGGIRTVALSASLI